jgi:hypothetical protein
MNAEVSAAMSSATFDIIGDLSMEDVRILDEVQTFFGIQRKMSS